jgi:hypothetical protein
MFQFLTNRGGGDGKRVDWHYKRENSVVKSTRSSFATIKRSDSAI